MIEETREAAASLGGNEGQWKVVSYRRHRNFKLNHRSQNTHPDSSSSATPIDGAGTNAQRGSRGTGAGFRGGRSRGRGTGGRIKDKGSASVNISTRHASGPSISAIGGGPLLESIIQHPKVKPSNTQATGAPVSSIHLVGPARIGSRSSWTAPHSSRAPTPAPAVGPTPTPRFSATPTAPGEHQPFPVPNTHLDLPARTVDTNDPELIIEYLALLSRRSSRNTVQLSDAEDQPPHKRIKIVVNALASIITSHPNNVAAVAMSITPNTTTTGASPVTKVYFTFNRTTDDILQQTGKHLSNVLDDLCRVDRPITPSASSLPETLIPDLIPLVYRLHNFSFEAFKAKVKEGVRNLETLRRSINGNPKARLSDTDLFFAMARVVEVARKEARDFEKDDAKDLLMMFLFLVNIGLLPDINEPGDYKHLEYIDKKWGTKFCRWVPESLQLVHSALALMGFASSYKARCTLNEVQFCAVENRVPSSSQYCFDASEEAFRNTVDLILSESPPAKPYTQENKKTIVAALLQECEVEGNTVTRSDASIHAEIALLMHIHSKQLAVYPHLGMSKFACSSCVELIKLLNESAPGFHIMPEAHRRFEPSWVFPPNLPSSIKVNMVNALRGLLLDEFATFIRSSDRSVLGLDSQGATANLQRRPSFSIEQIRASFPSELPATTT